MDQEFSQKSSGKTILVLERNVVVALDLEQCLRENVPDAQIEITHSARDAAKVLNGERDFRVAIVPHAMGSNANGAELFECLKERVPLVVLHGDIFKVAERQSDPRVLHLASPFTSDSVRMLCRNFTVF